MTTRYRNGPMRRGQSVIRALIAGLSLVMLATHPAYSESIQLEELHGVYMVPVRINDAITIP
jgi:hypothetical protein